MTRKDIVIELENVRFERDNLKRKLAQREQFIEDCYYILKNSNSKTQLHDVLLHKHTVQYNSQKLGVV